MATQKTQPIEPFWVDDPNPYFQTDTTKAKYGSQSRWISRVILIYSIFLYVVIFGLLIIFAINMPVFWFFVVFFAITASAGIYSRRFGVASRERAIRAQEHAKELTGADHIGSAIHTAGYPLLQANQPVVLALKEFELSIFSYDSSTPIDTISVSSIVDVSPVVYDDEYIPHVGVIDNTAQALQISIKRVNVDFMCTFRRMYKIRPIEWYQIIQKARLTEKEGSIGKM